jgi:hypothetical protein
VEAPELRVVPDAVVEPMVLSVVESLVDEPDVEPLCGPVVLLPAVPVVLCAMTGAAANARTASEVRIMVFIFFSPAASSDVHNRSV